MRPCPSSRTFLRLFTVMMLMLGGVLLPASSVSGEPANGADLGITIEERIPPYFDAQGCAGAFGCSGPGWYTGFVVKVTNDGPQKSRDVLLTVTWPPATGYACCRIFEPPPAFDCTFTDGLRVHLATTTNINLSEQIQECRTSLILKDQSIGEVYPMKMFAPGTYTMKMTVTSQTVDHNTSNNSASHTIIAEPAPLT